jgi:hypothetical protein
MKNAKNIRKALQALAEEMNNDGTQAQTSTSITIFAFANATRSIANSEVKLKL